MKRYAGTRPAALVPLKCSAGAAAVVITMLAALASPAACQTDRFFFKAVAGYSLPSIPSLSDELETQGRESVQGGFSGAVALGRTLQEKRWAFEFHFGLSIYPAFHYENTYEDFKGDLSHYDFVLLFKRCLLPEAERIIPYVGAGAGYGVTNLISGGGKIQTFHALALIQIEAPVREHISLLAECAYSAALTEKRFEKPFLENVSGDFVLDSDGAPLEDRFSDLSLRVGIMVWLRPQIGPEE
jgi:hypothetical protein